MVTKKIRLAIDANGLPISALHPDSVNEQLVESSTAHLSTSLQGVEVVRVWASADCHIAFGGIDVVAATSNLLLKANSPEYFHLRGDQYISVIQDSAPGNLYITPMN